MKDDRVYLRHILRCLSRIEQYTAAGRDSFFSSPLIQDGSIRNLQTMAESTRRLSDDLRARRPDVDWNAIAGFRNVLVHDYLGIDLELVYRVIQHDVPRLKEACETLLRELSGTA
jgi:uncharacterized protein with HEPN domain